jgi:Ca2+-binding RTX toxin-like protein
MPNDYTGLLTGSHWSGIEVYGKSTIVTYSFPTLATKPAYVATIDDPNLNPAALATWSAFSAAEQALAREALADWGDNSGLIFIEVAPGQGDINFQKLDFSGTGYDGKGGIAYRPFGNWSGFSYPWFSDSFDASGDVFMNSDQTMTLGLLRHEIGHAIGLKHPTEAWTQWAASPPVQHNVWTADDPNLTIMTQLVGTQVLTAIDLQAVQAIYGTQAQDGTQVASWSWNAGTQTLTQTGFAGDDAIRGSSVKDVIHGMAGHDRLYGLWGADTLNGNGGNDTLDGGSGGDRMVGGTGDDTYFVQAKGDKVIELAGEGYDTVFSTVSHTLAAHVEALNILGAVKAKAKGNGLDNAIYGGTGNSTLDGAGGDDYIVGNSGRDRIIGGAGADFVFGEGNADTFAFVSYGDFASSPEIDTIGDFSRAEGDKIDLKTIDPDPVTTGNQAFTFIGTAAFTPGAQYQVRYQLSGPHAVVQIDANRDGTADHEILLYNVANLQASDFIL